MQEKTTVRKGEKQKTQIGTTQAALINQENLRRRGRHNCKIIRRGASYYSGRIVPNFGRRWPYPTGDWQGF